MARTSGYNVLNLPDSWSQQQTFNALCNFNGRVGAQSGFSWTGVHLTAATGINSNTGPVVADATTAAFTITLPAGATAGELHAFVKADVSANAVTISGNGHNINGASTLVLSAQFQHAMIVWDGTTAQWWQIA